MPGNISVWRLWNLARTQWRAGAMGVIGLDYPAVQLTATIYGIKLTPRLMERIRLLEIKQLECWQESRDK
jgi:hypothetical protein